MVLSANQRPYLRSNTRQMRTLIGALTIALACLSSVSAKCRWFGVCGVPPGAKVHTPVPCTYSGDPVPLTNQTGLGLLDELCYGVFSSPSSSSSSPGAQDASSPSLCCDTDQLMELRTQFNVAQSMLRRCPACLANFQRYFCWQTCAPDQAEFMAIRDYSGMHNRNDEIVSCVRAILCHLHQSLYSSTSLDTITFE